MITIISNGVDGTGKPVHQGLTLMLVHQSEGFARAADYVTGDIYLLARDQYERTTQPAEGDDFFDYYLGVEQHEGKAKRLYHFTSQDSVDYFLKLVGGTVNNRPGCHLQVYTEGF